MRETIEIEEGGSVVVDTMTDRVRVECDTDGWSIAYLTGDEARSFAAALLAAADRAEGKS